MRGSATKLGGYLTFRILGVLVAIWLAFAASPTGFAQQGSVCPAPQNTCGCPTCGCSTQPSCPAGQSLFDDYCLPDCPGDYVRYPGSPGYCSPPCHHGCPEGFEPVPLPQCPQGYHRDLQNPDQCLSDPNFGNTVCPKGLAYSPETGKCSPQCPQGTYLDSTGLCTSNYQKPCPENYQRNPETGACVPPGIWPPTHLWVCMPLCPQGFVRDIEHPTRCLPPKNDCPQGYENVRGRCLPVCEQGYARDDYGYCNPPKQCDDGSYPDLRGRCHPSECPLGFDNIRGKCLPPCDQGTQRDARDPNKCIPVRQNCPDGTSLNIQTGQCDRVPPPSNNCKQGYIYNQRSGKCEFIPPPKRKNPDCPDGYTKTSSGKCIPTRQPPPQKQVDCGDGYQFNPNTGECVQINQQPKGCPDGMHFDRRRQHCVDDFTGGQTQPPDQPQIFQVNPNMLKLNPQGDACPDGMYRDNNGRCMPK